MRPKSAVKPPRPSKNALDAQAAGLRYVPLLTIGIRRIRNGNGFNYVAPRGKRLCDKTALQRIQKLVIPPAWKNVVICSDPRGHIQAVGWDQRGRKQYKYHPRWRETRDQNKYEKLIDFARSLPNIRKQVRRDLKLPGLPRPKVLATVVKLLECSHIRVGNEEYARENNSFGLTTMRNRHVHVNGSQIHLTFRGKSGVQHTIDLQDPRLAKVVRACQHLPGQELFQYLDENGRRHRIGSSDVNAYLQEIAGDEFTAKDFRTWTGTVIAATALRDMKPFTSQRQLKANVVRAIEAVAEELGNTKAVCRKCYIHPAVLKAYAQGNAFRRTLHDTHTRGLLCGEATVLHLLKPPHSTPRQ